MSQQLFPFPIHIMTILFDQNQTSLSIIEMGVMRVILSQIIASLRRLSFAKHELNTFEGKGHKYQKPNFANPIFRRLQRSKGDIMTICRDSAATLS